MALKSKLLPEPPRDMGPRERYFAHLARRLEDDEGARSTRNFYHRIFQGWLNECQRLNDGGFAWPPRYR